MGKKMKYKKANMTGRKTRKGKKVVLVVRIMGKENLSHIIHASDF